MTCNFMPSLIVSSAHEGDLMPGEVSAVKEVVAIFKLAEKKVNAVAAAGGNPALTTRGRWHMKRTVWWRRRA